MNEQVVTATFTPDIILRCFGESVSAHYLAEYLGALGATEILIEPQYVDRHFLEDYVEFYAKSFRTPPPHCQRLHFFSGGDDGPRLSELVRQAHVSDERLKEVEATLNRRYVGFVVQRPLRRAAMGRTVLRTYPGDPQRQFTVVRTYRAHVLGMKLSVEGLAYQEQDGGAAVCASTALWSAFQQVAHLSGERTPTPTAVTRAARSPFPAAHGLGDGDMARAIATLGYAADRLKPAGNTALFRAQVSSFLRSRHPVVLLLSATTNSRQGVGHAVTLTGYRESSPAYVQVGPSKELLRGASTSILYVHDDNLGSHAHYEFLDKPGVNGYPELFLLRGRSDKGTRHWWTPDEWRVDGALVPKPQKVRLPIEQLQTLMVEIGQLFRSVLLAVSQRPVSAIVLDAYYASGVEVQRRVTGSRFLSSDAEKWQRTHTLPRHVAIVEIAGPRGSVLLEFIFDATTLVQHQEGALAVLCPGVTADSTIGRVMAEIAQVYGSDIAFGGPQRP
jgi:hypothetical protein